ncbi:MAG TPA: 1,4-alpha-glucan branching protein GlgB [Clostridia bacterium]|nr:1,4-alpha-glucan branching protein GlgB [Clostridia bacterium]
MIAEESEFLTAFDLHLFHEGTHFRIYDKFGAHLGHREGQAGAFFAVWAPNAQRVSVVGDFNNWDREANPLNLSGNSGVWAGFIPHVSAGAAYRYDIVSSHQGYQVEKTDPVGFFQESSPRNVSFVWDLQYDWQDHDWMAQRGEKQQMGSPLAIYEVHLSSWMRVPEQGNRPLTYRELAPKLAAYVAEMGFTHVELLPVMDHPPGDMRSYQITGYFAPATRHGTPQDLMYLIDYLHQQRIGVILDWVPAHFPSRKEGLSYFDGTHLYEHGFCELEMPENDSACSFDYERREVRSFLTSSAFFWLQKYHADALRLDSVSAILHLDYGRHPGDWIPNKHGGRENLEGIAFLRQLNAEIYRDLPDVQTIAEEVTGWPLVSRPTHAGGLGFGYKWDDRFTRDTLHYFSHDPFFRKFHHQTLTSRQGHVFDENYVLALPHQEVAHGHGSLLARMPGDEWQRFANLRLLLGYLYLQPGKKLLFMGDEFGQWEEWNPQASLDWHLCAYPQHQGIQNWVRDLNRVYRDEKALHESDTLSAGFEWVDRNDAEQSTLSWLRRDLHRREVILTVCNFTPVIRRNVRVGVRRNGRWREILNSDARYYGGSGQGNFGGATTSPFSSQGFPFTLSVTLPPLAVIVFKYEGDPM